MALERILFGDNQFFGINHMSEERARAQAIRFARNEAIIEVLDAALDEGVRVFMCTTHDRIADICDHVRANPARYSDFAFYPCMPYAHKYANAAAEYGPLGAVRRMLPEENPVMAALQGGLSAATLDVEAIGRMLVDAEMKMFHGLKTPVIFLQNVVTDLLLGLGAHQAFRVFADHVQARYGAEPGFITMNLPRLLDALDAVGVDNPIVCANINKIGFRMCGGEAAYAEALQKRRCRAVAMSVFASGAIPASEAIDYVCRFPAVQSIVFGASSRGNIRETKRLIDAFHSAKEAA